MSRVLPIGLLILALSLPVLPHSPAHAQDPCAGLVARRLSAAGAGRVSSPYGVSLKDQPATSAAGANEIATLPFGTTFTVLDGPQCDYGYVWWQVQLASGAVGWAAEGDTTDYFLEPAVVGLDVYQVLDGGARIAHYLVTPDGLSQPVSLLTIQPVSATPRDTWQQVEIDRLGQALDTIRANCPDRLKGTVWENTPDLDSALGVPLPPLDYDFYPAPDGNSLLLVRHLTLRLPRCDTVLMERVGISNVSLLNADGTERLLFPYPQHGSVPASQDWYAPGEPDEWNVYLAEVVWSPDGKSIAFVAAYKDQINAETVYRFHLYIADLETGQLYVPGEGRHVAWANGGGQINFFRLVTESDNTRRAHLYTMRPDGAARQEIWLPGGAVYLSDQRADLGYPWNDGGTRVLVGNAGTDQVMLFNVVDRAFTPPIRLPDLMPQPNRLAVFPIKGETALLWTTIRGEFVTQDVSSGEWERLNSQVATTGVAPIRVRPFPVGSRVLIEMADSTAYILDVDADTLTPVVFAG